MEEKLRKKRIRNISLAIFAVIAVIAGVMALNVEKADYGKALGEEIIKAETALEEAVTGYEKGQYMPEVAVEFAGEIAAAKEVYEDESASYERHKEAYEILKVQIKEFKGAANKENMTPEDEAEPDDKDNAEKNQSAQSVDKDNKKSDKGDGSDKNNVNKEEKKIKVSIQIRCDNLSSDMSKLEDESKRDYVPADGVILGKTEYTCSEGTTVYDVLYAMCRNRNIHIESSYTPLYGSYYVEGINHIYEFDGGPESGWMYKVNGKYPDYGCSSFKLKDGDSIVWAYTCNLGKDLGNEF